MFWGCQLSKNKGVRLDYDQEIEDNDIASLHITNVVLGSDNSTEKVRVCAKLKTSDDSKKQKFTLAILQKDKKEFAKLNLYFQPQQEVQFFTEGGPTTVHLTGYFETLDQEDNFSDYGSEEDEEQNMEDSNSEISLSFDPNEYMSTDEYLRRRAKILRAKGIDPETEYDDLPESLKDAVEEMHKQKKLEQENQEQNKNTNLKKRKISNETKEETITKKQKINETQKEVVKTQIQNNNNNDKKRKDSTNSQSSQQRKSSFNSQQKSQLNNQQQQLQLQKQQRKDSINSQNSQKQNNNNKQRKDSINSQNSQKQRKDSINSQNSQSNKQKSEILNTQIKTGLSFLNNKEKMRKLSENSQKAKEQNDSNVGSLIQTNTISVAQNSLKSILKNTNNNQQKQQNEQSSQQEQKQTVKIPSFRDLMKQKTKNQKKQN